MQTQTRLCCRPLSKFMMANLIMKAVKGAVKEHVNGLTDHHMSVNGRTARGMGKAHLNHL